MSAQGDKQGQEGNMKLKEVSKIAYNQWHFERNKRLDPEIISTTSREIVYWQCKKKISMSGHHMYTQR